MNKQNVCTGEFVGKSLPFLAIYLFNYLESYGESCHNSIFPMVMGKPG